MGFETSKELFINIKNPPRWDPKKHYWDQSNDVIQFYAEEMHKIVHGVTIGGYFVHPWLYHHLNYFKTPIPTLNNYGKLEEVVQNPKLDDNIFYITESFMEAELKNKILFLFGTRGSTKTSTIASLTHWSIDSKPNGKFSITGGSAPDLKAISSLLETTFDKVNPAFYIPTNKKDWEKYVEFGFKDKGGRATIHSEIFISNFAKGSDNKSETGAGLSPIGYVLDEAGKSDFKKVLESAIPSFKTQHGWKLVPVVSGTSGNEVLSRDAKEILMHPDAFEVLPVNWDLLNKIVPAEYITWQEDKKSKFGTFMPAQMTYREAIPRKEVRFSDYLGIKHKDLDKIKIQTVDWGEANRVIKNLIDNPDIPIETREKNRMYYPLSIKDCFLTQGKNPFPKGLIEKKIRELEEEESFGDSIEIYKDREKTKFEFTDKKRAEISHPGGNVDAPIVLFGELPETPPEKYLFVSGLDDYKLDTSDTDSLGSMYVLKRRNMAPDEPCERILLSYTSRPDRHKDFHATVELIQDVTNAECLMEAVDMEYKSYLELKNKAEQLLTPSFAIDNTSDKQRKKKVTTTKYGLYPTAGNNRYRLELAVDFCKERHVIGIDENGNEIVKHGVDYIDDIDLLKELLAYKKDGNFDRYTAWSHALANAREMDKKGYRPSSQRSDKNILDNYRQGASPTKERKKVNRYNTRSGIKRY
jgi:hypothetical protein